MRIETKKGLRNNGEIILDGGQPIPVEDSVKNFWNSFERMERYQEEKKRALNQFSLDAMGYSPRYIDCQRYECLSPVEDAVMDSCRRGLIKETLARLPPKERQVIEAMYFGELSVSETARLIGCKRDTVCSREEKGLEHLREMLTECGINGE